MKLLFEVGENFHANRISILCIRFYKHSREKINKKEKPNIPIYFNPNYRREMKLVPIIMDYCLFQFDALKFFWGSVYTEDLYLILIFFNLNLQIF